MWGEGVEATMGIAWEAQERDSSGMLEKVPNLISGYIKIYTYVYIHIYMKTFIKLNI